MLRTRVRLTAAASLILLASAPAALAADYPPTPPPPAPTSAQGICVGDIPFFQYSVDFGSNGQFVGRPMTITFVNPNGSNFVINTSVPAAGQAQQVLWPGASQTPPDWPGWVLDADGQWVESTTDAGAFTRAPGGVEVQFAVNPTLTTQVTYPPSTAVCANPKGVKPTRSVTPTGSVPAGGGNTTPTTGANLVPALAGVGALAVGGGLVFASRRRRND